MRDDPARLEVCGGCGAGLLEAEQWVQLRADHWWFRLMCPECGWRAELIAERRAVERFERVLEAAHAHNVEVADAWRRSEMRDWALSFQSARDAGAALPMDFG